MKKNERIKQLTLDKPIVYKIRVSGYLEGDWSDWFGEVTIDRTSGAGPVESMITGTFDQAALHGLLRRLYSLGFPLVSVHYDRSDEGRSV